MTLLCPSCSTATDLSIATSRPDTSPDGTGTGEGKVHLPQVIGPGSLPKTSVIRNWRAGDPLPLLRAAQGAQSEFRHLRRARRAKIGAWAGLVALGLSPVAVAAMCPERVVSVIPSSIAAYHWAGQDVNIYGIEIRNIDLQHLIVDGKKIIALKGDLANTSASTRKIPWLRFGLLSKDNAEVYHWTLDTEVRPLKPGESTSFVTRLASPPEAARNVEIRFARADEIGSNPAHE